MRILFFSYWSIDDGITRATVLPLIESIVNDKRIEKIILCTVERPGHRNTELNVKKTTFLPLTSGQTILGKITTFLRFPFVINKIAKAYSIDFLWCRGAPAGGLAGLINMFFGTTFIVDSFEPHSEYMVDSGTWSRYSPKFWMQRWLEYLSKKRARLLLPVSFRYYQRLLKEGIGNDRLFVFPCYVDIERFAFREKSRSHIRNALSIADDNVVGIYVGKFGGLYYDDEAFSLHRSLFDYFGKNFFLILLTEMDSRAIFSSLEKHKIPKERSFVFKAPHEEVATYLSAADFAISTVKSVSAMRFCSPIKHGEYWAADLPILSTLLEGDDAEIITNEGGGVLLDVSQNDRAADLQKLENLIKKGKVGSMTQLAIKYRDSQKIKEVIDFVLKSLVTKQLIDD